MKKLTLVVLLVTAIVGLSVFSTYLVRRDEIAARHKSVDKAWDQVHGAMERRADLAPNVISSLRGIAARNRTTIADVEQAREEIQSAKTPVDAIAASRRLEGATARLFAAAQDDPDLLVNQKFFIVQEKWAVASNRIAPERIHYDQTVQDYNKFIAEFPNTVFARWASYTPMENAFVADANAASRTTAQLMQK